MGLGPRPPGRGSGTSASRTQEGTRGHGHVAGRGHPGAGSGMSGSGPTTTSPRTPRRGSCGSWFHLGLGVTMPGLGGRGSRAEGQPGPGGRDGLCPPRRQARALALGKSRSTLRCCTGPVAMTVSSPVWLSPAPARLPEEDSVALAGVGVQGRLATPSVACTSPEGGTGRLPQHGWVSAGTLPWALQMGQAWGGGEWGGGVSATVPGLGGPGCHMGQETQDRISTGQRSCVYPKLEALAFFVVCF